MSNKLFNSPFEMGLRIMLLLSTLTESNFSIERIVALDFISCYAADFNLPYANLHGNNDYRYGEIVSRHLLSQAAIKNLVIQGIVNITVCKGYLYSISALGKKSAKNMNSVYACEYKKIAQAVINKYKDYSDKEIMAVIHNSSVGALRG